MENILKINQYRIDSQLIEKEPFFIKVVTADCYCIGILQTACEKLLKAINSSKCISFLNNQGNWVLLHVERENGVIYIINKLSDY